MARISTLFWDVGGVLLSNAWDRELRHRAVDQFGLNWEEFQERHELVFHGFETGRVTLDSYLACTVFHRERSFTPDAFKNYMFELSTPLPAGLEILGRLAAQRRYRLAALNNESLELNLHRIERFKLRDYFSLFVSSCFVGLRKPEPEIYRLALNVTQGDATECVFIDDRALNVERARQVGMHAILYQSPEQLIADLGAIGVQLK
jgi:putative hydrolase of the HAD superfamily